MKSSTCGKLSWCQCGLFLFYIASFVNLFKTMVAIFLPLLSFTPSISYKIRRPTNLKCIVPQPKTYNSTQWGSVASFPKCLNSSSHLQCLLVILSILWCFHQGSKSWFRVMGECMPWNALRIVKINHKSYL